MSKKRIRYEYKYSRFAPKEIKKQPKPMRRTPYATVLGSK